MLLCWDTIRGFFCSDISSREHMYVANVVLVVRSIGLPNIIVSNRENINGVIAFSLSLSCLCL